MPRPPRTAPGGLVYHALNRANARRPIFETTRDYMAFERILAEVARRVPMRILAWCLMPNHWHLLLWPDGDDDLSSYMRLVTLIHTQRWHAHRRSTGSGHLYQGRFKSFVVQDDAHLLTVGRYVEANALRAAWVNEVPPGSETRALRAAAQRGTPFGAAEWAQGMAGQLGLECTLRLRGRPLRQVEKGPDPFL